MPATERRLTSATRSRYASCRQSAARFGQAPGKPLLRLTTPAVRKGFRYRSMSTHFRYSVPKFRQTVVIAAALTALVSALAWMLLVAFSSRHPWLWTALVGTVFFGFVSAPSIMRYMRNETVLAVLPTGLYHARTGADPISWESIREIVLRQAENEFQLDVYLWKPQGPIQGRNQGRSQGGPAQPDMTIELAPLDAPPAAIVESIGRHARIRLETGQLAGVMG
jgi:hypothetical protein